MAISIKIDEEDHDRLMDLRDSKNTSVRLVIKSILDENAALKERVQALIFENTMLKNAGACELLRAKATERPASSYLY